MNQPYIRAIQDAIRHTHGCASRHVATEHVKEEFQGKPVWEGDVELFDLIAHPQAHQCYAWGFQDDGGRWQYVAVLKVKGVDTPVKAVRAYIIQARRA